MKWNANLPGVSERLMRDYNYINLNQEDSREHPTVSSLPQFTISNSNLKTFTSSLKLIIFKAPAFGGKRVLVGTTVWVRVFKTF